MRSWTLVPMRSPVAAATKGGTMTTALQEGTTLERLLGTVAETMRSDVVLLAADMPAERAALRLEYKAVSGAPVVDHGRVAGVITLRDLLVPTLLDPPRRQTHDAYRCVDRWRRDRCLPARAAAARPSTSPTTPSAWSAASSA